MKKLVQIIMLPSDDKTVLRKDQLYLKYTLPTAINNSRVLPVLSIWNTATINIAKDRNGEQCVPQELYFISPPLPPDYPTPPKDKVESMQKGDWFYYGRDKVVDRYEGYFPMSPTSTTTAKIIATTVESIVTNSNGVTPINTETLRQYVATYSTVEGEDGTKTMEIDVTSLT